MLTRWHPGFPLQWSSHLFSSKIASEQLCARATFNANDGIGGKRAWRSGTPHTVWVLLEPYRGSFIVAASSHKEQDEEKVKLKGEVRLAIPPTPRFASKLSNDRLGSSPSRPSRSKIPVEFRGIPSQYQGCLPKICWVVLLCLCRRKWQRACLSWSYPFLCRSIGPILRECMRIGSSLQFLQGVLCLRPRSWVAGWYGMLQLTPRSPYRSTPSWMKSFSQARFKRRASRLFLRDWSTWISWNRNDRFILSIMSLYHSRVIYMEFRGIGTMLAVHNGKWRDHSYIKPPLWGQCLNHESILWLMPSSYSLLQTLSEFRGYRLSCKSNCRNYCRWRS